MDIKNNPGTSVVCCSSIRHWFENALYGLFHAAIHAIPIPWD